MWKNKTNIFYILYILQKTNLEKKSQQYYKFSFYWKDISTFKDMPI